MTLATNVMALDSVCLRGEIGVKVGLPLLTNSEQPLLMVLL
jgi:hypothetical protein